MNKLENDVLTPKEKKDELGRCIDKLARSESDLEFAGFGDLVEESGLRKAIDNINRHYTHFDIVAKIKEVIDDCQKKNG